MKNICLVIPSLRHGGAERVISVLANEWAKNPNLSVSLIILTKQKKYYQLDKRVKVIEPYKDYNKNAISKLIYTLWSLYFIRKTISGLKPDSILSFCERYNNLVLLSLIGKPFNVFVSDRNNPSNNIGKLHEFLRKKLYIKAKGIVAQTDTAKSILYTKTRNNNIKAIPNPLREIVEYNSVARENVIINVGRFEPQKNQKELIKIFSLLKESNNWKLRIIGIGSLKSELEKLIVDLKLSNKVELLDFQENIDHYFQQAKIFAFTSIFEGFPNALSEAMANGLAPIAYDCPTGPSELIENNVNGDLIPLNDNNMFLEKLEELIKDNNKLNRYSLEASKVRDKYSVSQISNQYLKFILDETNH